MLVAGIDPGRDGGICILDERAKIVALRLLSSVSVKSFLFEHKVKIVWIEKAQPMGKENSTAMFNYGREYGYILGTLAGTGIDVNFVPPSVWTKQIHSKSAVAIQHAKSASEYAAKAIWPGETFLATEKSRKAHDGLYEAALIAYYGISQELKRACVSD